MLRLGRPLEMLCERGGPTNPGVFKSRIDESINVLLACSSVEFGFEEGIPDYRILILYRMY